MTKGEKGYSQTGRSIAPGTGTFPGGQQAVCRRRIGSETCFHRISETEQKFFEFPFQKAQFLQVCLLVSACIGSYFKKTVLFLSAVCSRKRAAASPCRSANHVL